MTAEAQFENATVGPKAYVTMGGGDRALVRRRVRMVGRFFPHLTVTPFPSERSTFLIELESSFKAQRLQEWLSASVHLRGRVPRQGQLIEEQRHAQSVPTVKRGNSTGADARNDNIVSPEQVAERLGLSPETLAQWRSQERGIRFVKLSRNRVGYRWVDVEQWIEQQTRTPRDQRGRR